MDFLRKTWAEIDTAALIHNLKEIKKIAEGSKLFAVVKANAYGHYAEILAPILQKEGVDAFAVSNLIEAEELRQYGISKPILILGYTPVEEVNRLVEYDISQAVYSTDYAKALNDAAAKQNLTVKVHIKLDTGMGRLGFNCRNSRMSELDDAINSAKLESFETLGVFTHFAVSDRTENDEDGFTNEQYSRFKTAIDAFKSAGFLNIVCHAANSAALALDKDKRLDYCRPGIILYGLTPNSELKLPINIKPLMSFKTVVTMVKTVDAGDTVSYGRTYKAEKKQRLATLAVGYADGYPRALSNKGYVLIHGKKAPIVGRVCMDQVVVNISEIENVKIGDEVLLFGKELPVEEIAKLANTINYEIITNISPRVPRITV